MSVTVEGFSDVIALHKHGIVYANGVMGSTVSSTQMALNAMLADHNIYLFDGDEAGEEAARSLSVDANIPAWVGSIVIDGYDPCEAVAKGLPVETILTRANHLIEEFQYIKFAADGKVIQAVER